MEKCANQNVPSSPSTPFCVRDIGNTQVLAATGLLTQFSESQC